MQISPEIWANLLPVATAEATPVQSAGPSVMPGSLANDLPSAPTDDLVELRKRAQKQASQKLEILVAVCDAVDVTDDVRELIQSDGTLTIDTRSIPDLLAGHSQPQRLKADALSLAFVFRYADHDMQLFVNSPAAANQIWKITPTSTEYPIVKPSTWNKATWSTVAVVFGGKHITEAGAISKIWNAIEGNYKDGAGTRHVDINPALINDVSSAHCGTLKPAMANVRH